MSESSPRSPFSHDSAPFSGGDRPTGEPPLNRKISDAFQVRRGEQPPAELWDRIEAAARSRRAVAADPQRTTAEAVDSHLTLRPRTASLRSQLVAASIGFVGFWTAIGLIPARDSTPPPGIAHGITEISRLIPELNTTHPADALDWFPELRHFTEVMQIGAVRRPPELPATGERKP